MKHKTAIPANDPMKSQITNERNFLISVPSPLA